MAQCENSSREPANLILIIINMPAAVDYFIQAANFLEHNVLDPLLKPAETHLVRLARSSLPASVTAAVESFMSTQKSVHAEKLPLMNPVHVVALILAYFAIVAAGKWVMENLVKERFQLKAFSQVHNAFLVWLSGYMAVNILYQAFAVRGYTLFGNPNEEFPAAFPVSLKLSCVKLKIGWFQLILPLP